jgi:predicted metal-binding membrane protein
MNNVVLGQRADRTAVYLGLAGVAAVGWAVTVRLAAGMRLPEDPAEMASAMPSAGTQLLLTAAMWAAMMVGMMVPSATPMVVAYTEWTRRGAGNGRRAIAVASFLAGYLVVWSAFSLMAAGLHVALDRAGLLTSMGAVARPVVGGTLLVVAGAFQLSPWKESCLRACRSPFGFLVGEWRDGARGALTMGVRHGALCLGCCWLLMAVLFVVGTMHLAWMAAVAVFVLVEKVAPRRLRVGRTGAVVLIGWGMWTLLAAPA